jgi:hypothetical protein
VRRDGSPSTIREALAGGGKRELALYLVAAAIYIAIGVAVPEFLFTWVVAAGFLLLVVAVVPYVVRRLRQ